jgi:hypothetical protein
MVGIETTPCKEIKLYASKIQIQYFAVSHSSTGFLTVLGGPDSKRAGLDRA